jgi:hypothetical protein
MLGASQPQIMTRDFRADAADATLARLGSSSGMALAGWGESCCAPVGGRRFQFWQAMIFTAVSFALLGSSLIVIVLSFKGVLSREGVMLLLFVLLVASLLARMPQAAILKAYVSSRPDGFSRAFPILPAKPIGLEEGRTYKKSKFVIEDSGVCLLDPERQRLLLEGCQYRYVIRAKDVASVEPVAGYALSGARINCRVAGHQLDFVLTTAGQGPLASLLHAFVPSEGAKGLASELNRTLFGQETPSYQQALPPPLPMAGA